MYVFREVTVLRLICPGTIEEAILRCAETKLKLEKDLSHSNGEWNFKCNFCIKDTLGLASIDSWRNWEGI